jgi:septal ring factor EnvC (AmiA/AmiB activator)
LRFFSRITAGRMHSLLLPLSSSLLALFVLYYTFSSNAESASPKKELGIVKEKIRKEKRKIEEAINKEKSILSELQRIDRSVKNKKKELRYYDDRLTETTKRIRLLQGDVSNMTDKIEAREKLLKDRIRFLYKEQYSGYTALVLVSARNYQDLLTRSRYVSMLAHYDRTLMDTYTSEIKSYTLKKKEMELLRQQLETDKKKIQKNVRQMKTERIEKDKMLAEVKSKRGSYEKMVNELQESSSKLQKMIEDLEEKKKKELKSVPGVSFRTMKGGLPWPVSGKVLVPFGKYKDPKFNIPVFKNGIEIKANMGDAVKSVHGGRVVYADWFKGYGLLLILNHGEGYHSLYGNLSEIFYKTGDIIKKGSSVGSIAEKGLLSVPTLYFEIRHRGQPLDPLGWLQRGSKKKRRVATKENRRVKPKIKKR